jgi:hypothetical protein
MTGGGGTITSGTVTPSGPAILGVGVAGVEGARGVAAAGGRGGDVGGVWAIRQRPAAQTGRIRKNLITIGYQEPKQGKPGTDPGVHAAKSGPWGGVRHKSGIARVMWGRLAACAAVVYRRSPVQTRGVPSGSGRLPIGRSLPSCPTTVSPAWRRTYAQIQAVLLMNRVGIHFCAVHPALGHPGQSQTEPCYDRGLSGLGLRATDGCKPRQVRKEATVVVRFVCRGLPGAWHSCPRGVRIPTPCTR